MNPKYTYEVQCCDYNCRLEDRAGFRADLELEREMQNLQQPNPEKPERNYGSAKQIRIGRHIVLHGDCRTGLRMIPEDSVHLVVTSPPYNVGIAYGSSDDRLPFEQYLAFTKEWLAECYRALVEGGRICINIPLYTYRKSNQTSLLVAYHSLMREVGFLEREIIIWVKKRKSDGQLLRKKKIHGTFNPRNPMMDCPSEAIIVMNKGSPRLEGRQPDLTYKEFLEWRLNVWEMDTEMNRTHPAPYPSELPRRLMKFFSFPNQVVLDPFLGSGTTMKIADELNRMCIGCELDAGYVEIVKERMRGMENLVCARR